jgi:hypothetical protein
MRKIADAMYCQLVVDNTHVRGSRWRAAMTAAAGVTGPTPAGRLCGSAIARTATNAFALNRRLTECALSACGLVGRRSL